MLEAFRSQSLLCFLLYDPSPPTNNFEMKMGAESDFLCFSSPHCRSWPFQSWTPLKIGFPVFGSHTCKSVANTTQLLLSAHLFYLLPHAVEQSANTLTKKMPRRMLGLPPMCFPSLQVPGSPSSNCLRNPLVPWKMCSHCIYLLSCSWLWVWSAAHESIRTRSRNLQLPHSQVQK